MVESAKIKYLDPSVVVDKPGATQKKNLRWVDPLDNYDFDSKYAYSELLNILSEN